jgi:hypothetical protein
MALMIVVAVALTGCDSYKAGEPFREGAEDQATPEAAVQKWLGSMEWLRNAEGARDPNLGRDFTAFFEVSSPVLFPEGANPDSEDVQDLKDNWNSQNWEIEFLDLQFETISNDGSVAVIKIMGGQTRYIGKEMFGTTEYKVDNFKDKPGKITLEQIDGAWRVIKGQMTSDDELWEVQ